MRLPLCDSTLASSPCPQTQLPCLLERVIGRRGGLGFVGRLDDIEGPLKRRLGFMGRLSTLLGRLLGRSEERTGGKERGAWHLGGALHDLVHLRVEELNGSALTLAEEPLDLGEVPCGSG